MPRKDFFSQMTSKFDPKRAGIAVDLGGTAVKVGIVNGVGDILAERSIPTLGYEGPQRVVERIAETANVMRDEVGVTPVGLGFGAPGLVDVGQGITRFLPNLGPNWNDFPVKDVLEPCVKCPVRVMNDARAATLGELNFGHGHGARKTLVFFGIGTGLGGGVVVDGKLRLGPFGAAGELGHMIVQPHGRACGCGNEGCLEAYVSGPALAGEGVRLMRSGQAPILYDIVDGDSGKVDARTMSDAAAAGDEAVIGAIETMADYLAIGISWMIHAIHPDMVVIGGGVANLGDLLLEPVRKGAARYTTMFSTKDIEIVPSMLGDRTGLLGAAALALSEEGDY